MPVIRFGNVSAQPSHDGIEIGALARFDERFFGCALADLVRINRPEIRKPGGGRAPFRGRRGYVFFFRGCGGYFFFCFRRFRGIPQTLTLPILRPTALGLFINHLDGFALSQCCGCPADQIWINPSAHHVRYEGGYTIHLWYSNELTSMSKRAPGTFK